MISKRRAQIRFFVGIIVAGLLAASATSQSALAQGCCSSKSSKSASASDCHSEQSPVSREKEPAWIPPHGGQVYKGLWNHFEVVYGPQETRIYVYDIFHERASVRGMQGWVFLRVRSNGGQYRYPLRHAVERDGRDYLAFHVDLTRVHDGDMDVQLELNNMPNGHEQTVRIGQVFAMHPSFRTAMVAANRARMPQPAASPHANPARSQGASLADATTADRAAIERQRVCPVMGSKLGEHGTPIKVTVNGGSVFVCCRGCIDKVLQQPNRYVRTTSLVGNQRM